MIINPHAIPDLGLRFDTVTTFRQIRYLADNPSDIIKQKPTFYVYLRHEIGISKLLSSIDKKQLNAIRNKEVVLAIDFVEARYSILDEIYNKLIIQENIPPSQILLIGASPDLKNAIITRSRQLDIDPIHLDILYLWEKVVKELAQKHPNNIYNPMIRKNHSKVYINLNHFFRVHRAYMVSMLREKSLLEFGYNSFHNAIDNEELELYKKKYPDLTVPDTIHLDIDNDKSQISGSLTRQIVTYKIDSLVDYVNDSILHLISETQFFDGPRDLSEKTFKPIAFKQPFIFVGQHGCLKLLRELGYKTFHGIIDESYDDLIDGQQRLDAIISEIERICNLSEQQKIEFCEKCIDIVNHNYDLLMSKTNYTFKLL